MARITLEHYGVEGTGETVKAAKEDADGKIAKMVRNYHPRIWSHRGATVIVYQTPFGGADYTITNPHDEGQKLGCSCCGDFADAEASALRHLLTNTRLEGEYDIPDWVPSSVDRKNLIDDWKRCDAFQKAYRKALADGLKDGDAHTFACHHQYEFMAA